MEKTNNISYLLKVLNKIQLISKDIEEEKIFQKKLSPLKEMLQCAESRVENLGGLGAFDKTMENKIKYGLCRLEFLLNELQQGGKSGNNKRYLSNLAKEIFDEIPSFPNPGYEAHTLVTEVKLDGRRMREVQEIVDLLLSSDSMSTPVLVFPILGTLGSGKTTFVHLVCTNERVQKRFRYTHWLDISGARNSNEILRQVVQKLSKGNNYSDLSTDEVASFYKEHCSKLEYLLVLEDLSDDEGGKWFDLLNPLMCVLASCNPGSKIFVTSRSASVQTHDLDRLPMAKGMPHRLGNLHHYDSVDFFNNIAFRGISEHEREPHLKSTALEITNKCANNLQVIIIVASILSFLPHPKWKDFNKVALGTQYPSEHILSVVELMHQQLLNYYSLFPCDYQFGKEELNRLWEAQEQSVFSEPSEETADIKFEKLLGNEYLFECHKSDESGILVYYKGKNGLVHQLAKHLARDEYRLFEKPAVKEVDHLGIQHMSFVIDSTWEPPSWLHQAKHYLKSLLFFPNKSNEFITIPDINLILGKLKALIALNLAAVNCRSLNSIWELKHLRYLKVGICFESLPECITNLKFLQTLDLRCSRVRELPRGFHKLCHLRHLYVGDRLTDLPPRFGELTELQSLDVFIVGQNNGLDALANINRLAGKLRIHYRRGHEEHVLNKEVASLKGKKLHELLLEWPTSNEESSAENYQEEDAMKPELLQPPPTLKSLTIKGWRGQRFPQWAINNLVSIHIVDCNRCKHLPSISKLGYLKSLQLWGLNALEWIEICDSKSSETLYFRSLEHLSLVDLPQLKGWFKMEEPDHETIGFPELTLMPQMPNLQSIEASNIRNDLLQKLFSVQASTVSSSSSSPALPMLQSIHILSLTNMSMPESLPRGFECLTTLTEITLCWLYNLTILPESIGNLAHLHQLIIRYLPNLVNIPESLAGLSALKHVEIRYCPRLKQIPKYFSNLKSLQLLKIKECVNLEKRCQSPNGEDWPLIQHIPNVYLG